MIFIFNKTHFTQIIAKNEIQACYNFYNVLPSNASLITIRWPLDHVYVTDDFKFIRLARLGEFGSDHFPVYAELVLSQ